MHFNYFFCVFTLFFSSNRSYTESMIKTILFDLDDTLFDFKECEREALSEALTSFDISFSREDISDYSLINDRMWKMLERGEITRETLRVKRFEVFLSRYPSSPSALAFAERYMEALSRTSALISGARELLEALRNDYALYAVTNGYELTQMGRLKSADLGKYFLGVFISQCIGFVKPKREFFDYCASHIPDFDLESTVLVGDSLTSDISGGKEYGLLTVRYNPKGDSGDPSIRPDYEIHTLDELPALLKKL